MNDKSKADLESWTLIILEYARHFADRESRTWFSGADISTNYDIARAEFNETGKVTSAIGCLVSHLPHDHVNGGLDFNKIGAITDLMMARGLLEDAKNFIYKDSKTITLKGREYLAMHELSAKPELSDDACRVVIITIRDDEYLAVFDRLQDTHIFLGTHRTYVNATLKHASGADVSVYLIKQAEQGPNAAHDTARDAIEDLDPDLIVVSGIAGAAPDNEFTLGDVVAVTRFHDFVVGAAKDGGVIEVADQGGPSAKRVQDLIALLPALSKGPIAYWRDPRELTVARPTIDLSNCTTYGGDAWEKKVRESLETNFGPTGRNFPIVTGRAIASSGMLVKDAALLKRWIESSREICAVEMELSGVYAASRRADKDYPILAIRGISDVVGLKRDANWTAYACQTAASFGIALLKHAPLELIAGKGKDSKGV
ncbi:hypothetical protein [Burkholderia guangdongensis]|uniref:5'-methylthioadenosine/S-adenosylhomocysteine nucleosidase family protein n=1 Tax=Burkholderia guangdongensis TaxID=1792500 RepID=UPI0015CE4924|nr:hypothetical protein [Burkholderia guangdongensis]